MPVPPVRVMRYLPSSSSGEPKCARQLVTDKRRSVTISSNEAIKSPLVIGGTRSKNSRSVIRAGSSPASLRACQGDAWLAKDSRRRSAFVR